MFAGGQAFLIACLFKKNWEKKRQNVTMHFQ